ncbi:hypothetical protein Tco_0827129 [Tanacetum coccineum]
MSKSAWIEKDQIRIDNFLKERAGNPIRRFIFKLNLPGDRVDHQGIRGYLKDGVGSQKSRKVSVYEHVGSKGQSHRWKVYKMAKRGFCLVDDLKVFKESHSRQDEEQAQDLKSMITT